MLTANVLLLLNMIQGSSSEEEWVTKEVGTKNEASSGHNPKPAADRDDWMDLGSFIPTYSNESKRAKRQEEKDAKKNQASIESVDINSILLK